MPPIGPRRRLVALRTLFVLNGGTQLLHARKELTLSPNKGLGDGTGSWSRGADGTMHLLRALQCSMSAAFLLLLNMVAFRPFNSASLRRLSIAPGLRSDKPI